MAHTSGYGALGICGGCHLRWRSSGVGVSRRLRGQRPSVRRPVRPFASSAESGDRSLQQTPRSEEQSQWPSRGGQLSDFGIVPPCGICGHCGRGDRILHHLTHGLSVWLCQAHRSDGFLQRRGGREFVERLAAAWMATGKLTVNKRDALVAHIRRVETAGAQRARPGSYSWPALRREAERRFATGDPPSEVISELRLTYRDGPAMVPSVRTMRRWYTQGRWNEATPNNRRRVPQAPARPSRVTSPWQPLIELILTGHAYPSSRTSPHRRSGP